MSWGTPEQLEPGLWKQICWNPKKPWQIQGTQWRKLYKMAKNRRERRRVKLDVECVPEYKKYKGYEW